MTKHHRVALITLSLAVLAGPTLATFQPADIPGLTLWVRADAGVTGDAAGRVSKWADQSGNGNDFAQTNATLQPILSANAAGALPAVRFDGMDDALQLAKPINPSGASVFAVVRWNKVRAYSFAIGLDHGTDGYLRMMDEQALLTGGWYPVLYQNMIACPKTVPAGYGPARPFLHTLPSRLTQFNVFAVTDNPVTNESIKWLGQNELNNVAENRFDGDIAEMLIYTRALPPAERMQVEEYLGSKYLQWPEPGTVPVVPIAGTNAPPTATATNAFTASLSVGTGGIVCHGIASQPLPAGRYRFALEVAGDMPAALTNREVTLRVGRLTIPLPRARRPSASEFHPLSSDFEIPHGTTPEAALVRVSWTVKPSPATNAAPTGVTPPFAVRNVRIETLSPVKVVYARPDKIRYRPGEAAKAEVRVVNTADQPQTVEVRGSEVTDLDARHAIGTQTLTVPPAATNALAFPFTPSPVEYGRDLLVEIAQDGRVIESATDPFSVADNAWKVAIGANPGGPAGSSADAREEVIVAQIASFRDDYANCWEKYFWAPDDWGDMTPPPGATWYSGQARRHENTEKIKLQVETSHRYGIAVATYGKCMAGGSNGWEMARANPQWFVTDLYGRTMGRPAAVWDFDHWQEAGKFKYSDYEYDWTYRWVDLRRLDALDYGIDELIASTKEFGWDGVRYDSGGFRAHYVDGNFNGFDPVNARNMKRTKERLWQAVPGYLFGFNTDNVTTRDGRSYPLTVGEMSHEMREMLAGGGLWMGEGIKNFENGGVAYTNWSQFAADEGRCIRAIKEAGGHACYLFNTGTPVREAYQLILAIAMGAHPYGGEHVGAPGSENWGRFLTRWSGLFWDHRLKPMTNAEDRVTVDASGPLWWRQFANERILSAKQRQVIVTLVNPPVDDSIAKNKDVFPEPAPPSSVSLKTASREKVRGAWLISPGTPNRCVPLKFQDRRGTVKVAVPAFDIWAIVVFDCEGRYRPPAHHPPFTEPLSATETAELGRTTTAASTNAPPWFGMRPPAPSPNVAIADNPIDPAPQYDPRTPAVETKPSSNSAPAGLTVGGGEGLDVLIVNGFYYRFHRVPDAIRAVAPQARIVECTTRDLPKGYAAVFKYDLIVLVDMGMDAWDSDGQQQLADFVQAGGRLAVLGGPFTLGQGHFGGSLLKSVLPVEVRPARDVYELPTPLALGPEK